MIWTTICDAEVMRAAYGEELFATRFGADVPISLGGYTCQAYPQFYEGVVEQNTLSGGNAPYSLWLQ